MSEEPTNPTPVTLEEPMPEDVVIAREVRIVLIGLDDEVRDNLISILDLTASMAERLGGYYLLEHHDVWATEEELENLYRPAEDDAPEGEEPE